MEDKTNEILILMHDNNLSYLEAQSLIEQRELDKEHEQFMKEAYNTLYPHEDYSPLDDMDDAFLDWM